MFQRDTSCIKVGKNLVKMFVTVVHCVEEDKHIITINKTNFPSKICMYHVQCTLEGCECVSQTKWHSLILIYISVKNERGFGTIFLAYIHLPIT